MIGAILFGGFVVFLTLGVPIAFVLALSALGAISYASYPIEVLAQRLFTALDSFPLMAIPLFMLAGTLMSYGGITRTIVDFALAFVGNVRGSLAHVVAISGVIMGGISGSGVADTAALGTVMIPEMTKRKYNREFSPRWLRLRAALGSSSRRASRSSSTALPRRRRSAICFWRRSRRGCSSGPGFCSILSITPKNTITPRRAA